MPLLAAQYNICNRMLPFKHHIRRQSIPVIYVKGSYFEVGYDIGRTFGSLIHSFMEKSNEVRANVAVFETAKGKESYDRLLNNVTKYYPQYVQELKGMSEGAKLPFYKELIGHTEDGLKDVLNYLYIVKAHITECEQHEVFTALCYAGLLPGYSMGFNIHGLVFTINIIHALHLNNNGIPRTFVARALLTADTFQKVENILQCKSSGIADSMSVNFSFLNKKGDRLFYNIEVGPNYPPNTESSVSILTISPGEKIFHCNKLLHLVLPEDRRYEDSSIIRHKTKDAFGDITNKTDLIQLLGDTSHSEHNIFRDGNTEILTLAVGIFDFLNKTWTVYLDNPKTSNPIVIIPLEMIG